MSRQIFAISASFFSPSAAIRKGKNSAFNGRLTLAIVVGYAPAELQDGGITAGTCFIPISGGKVDLTEMKVTGYTGETKGEVYVQTLNEFGHNTANYYWYDYTNKKGKKIVAWLDEDDAQIEKGIVEFQAGEGLWATSDGDGFGFQSSGQVPTSKIVVELQDGGLSVANPTPVSVDLTACAITGYAGETKGEVFVQTLNEFGHNTANYYWYDYTNKKGAKVIGWLDEDDALIGEDTVTMDPGVGIWATSDGDGFNFEFPGVEVK